MPDIWGVLAALNRWILYSAMLMASGSALCLVQLQLPAVAADVAARLGRLAAIIAAPAYVLAVGFGGAEMLGGELPIILSARAWSLGFDTSIGLSAMLGIPAMLLLIYAHSTRRDIMLLIAALLAIGSFGVTGHAATAAPVWLTAPSVGIHVLCAAFWFGALAPLYIAAGALPAREAGAMMTRFSVQAIYAVSAIVLSGCVVAAVQVEKVAALTATEYGQRLIVKLALVALIVCVAAYNKLVLTPKLNAGDEESKTAIRRSIMIEIFIYLLIVAAAVSLTMTAPPRSL